MESKKTPQADLPRISGMFLNLGFAIALAMTFFAFEYKTDKQGIIQDLKLMEAEFDAILDIPSRAQTPPPPMAVPIMRKTATKPEVKDVIQISFEIENEATIKEIDVPEIIICPEYTFEFEVMESYPNPAGGMIGWKQYLSMNLRYPTQARRLGIEGSVILAFIVNIEGNLEDIEVLGDIGGGCAEEAVRVVSDSPRWEPGKQRGRPVRTRMRLPIKFKLD